MARRLGWVAIGMLCLGCGGGGDDAPPATGSPEGTSETPEDDYLTYELDFRDDAAVLDDLGAVQASLVRADYALGEFVFDSEMAGLDALEEGRAAVIAGVGVFRVTGRESTAEGELVRVEAAPLTDVLENAHIAWRRSFVSAYADARLGLGVGESEAGNIGKERAAESSFLDGKLHYEGKLGNFASILDLAPGPEGLHFAVAATFQGSVGSMTSKMNGHVRSITHESELEIIDGVVYSYNELYYNVSGRVNIEVASARIEGEAKLGFPARLSLPVMVGPIPFRIDLGSSIEIASKLGADSTAEYVTSIDFVANAGVRFTPDEGVKYISSLDTTNLEVKHSAQMSSVTAGISTLLNFPELSIGVGVPEIADAVAYMRFRSEGITNGAILLDDKGEPDGICVEAGANFGATYGGDAKFLGVSVFKVEKPLFGRIGDKRKSPDCE